MWHFYRHVIYMTSKVSRIPISFFRSSSTQTCVLWGSKARLRPSMPTEWFVLQAISPRALAIELKEQTKDVSCSDNTHSPEGKPEGLGPSLMSKEGKSGSRVRDPWILNRRSMAKIISFTHLCKRGFAGRNLLWALYRVWHTAKPLPCILLALSCAFGTRQIRGIP